MKRALLVPTLALALLVPAALAVAASLPQPSDSSIVVPKSLGGIKVNMPEAKAKAAWGSKRGECTDYSYGGACRYGSSEGGAGSAAIEFVKGKVAAVAVLAGRSAKGDQLTTAAGPLSGLRTSGGIGLGSKFSSLKKAFPKGERTGYPGDVVFYWTVHGPGKHAMIFSLLSASKKVFQVYLSNGQQG